MKDHFELLCAFHLSTYPSSISLRTTVTKISLRQQLATTAQADMKEKCQQIFNFTLRSYEGRLNCCVRSTYPSSISLRTTVTKISLRQQLATTAQTDMKEKCQ